MLHSSCTAMTPSLCNSLCTPSPLETVGVHHPCSSWKTVLWQRFGLPTIAVHLLTPFCLFIKVCVPFQIPFGLHPLQDVLHSWPRPDCSHWHCLYSTQAPKTVSPFQSCFLWHSELYSALSWVLNNFRLLFFPFQCSLCSLYQKHKSFFSGTLGYFFEERLRWCPDIHLIPGPVDQEGKKSADKTKASVLEPRREYF